MSRFDHLLTLIIDLSLIIAIWIFNLNTEYALSVIIFQLIMSFGAFLITIILNNRKKTANNGINIIGSFIAVGLFYLIVNALHLNLPNSHGSHIDFIRNSLTFEDFWSNLNYLILTIVVILKLGVDILRNVKVVNPKLFYQRIYFTIYKVFTLTAAVVIAGQLFIDHPKQEITEIPEFSRAAMTITIVGFTILDALLYMKLKTLKKLKSS